MDLKEIYSKCEHCEKDSNELIDCSSCDTWICKNCQYEIKDHYDAVYCANCIFKCEICDEVSTVKKNQFKDRR